MKLKSKDISNAKTQLAKLIKRILKTHPRSKAKLNGKHVVEKKSGDLFREIQPQFSIKDGKLIMEVRMMEYYKWLDEGTKNIEGWYFSEEIMDSKDIAKLTENLVQGTILGRIDEMISTIQKK